MTQFARVAFNARMLPDPQIKFFLEPTGLSDS